MRRIAPTELQDATAPTRVRLHFVHPSDEVFQLYVGTGSTHEGFHSRPTGAPEVGES